MTRLAPRVSVVIPAYNSDRTIGACLSAITLQRTPATEVIVVNSSPERRTSEIVAQFPGVIFHQHAVRLLPHAARNVGVSMTQGDLIVFTDPDCLPAVDWLTHLVVAYVSGADVIQGTVHLKGGSWLERGIHLCKRFSVMKGVHAPPPWIVSSINAAYSREAWNAAGPLDGDVFCGDALLGWRAVASGFRVQFAPEAVVLDHHDQTLTALIKERYMRGREFAAMRAPYEHWSRRRATAFALGAGALLTIVLARAARMAASAGWLRDFLLTFPVQIAGQAAWIVGESRAYAAFALDRDAM